MNRNSSSLFESSAQENSKIAQNSSEISGTSDISSEASDVSHLSGELTTDDSEDGDELNKIFIHKRLFISTLV